MAINNTLNNFEFTTSPYYKRGYVVYLDETPALFRKKLVYTPNDNDVLHEVKQDETLDSIAGNRYGNSKLWWLIADVNNQIISPFDTLSPGTYLVIPPKELADV